MRAASIATRRYPAERGLVLWLLVKGVGPYEPSPDARSVCESLSPMWPTRLASALARMYARYRPPAHRQTVLRLTSFAQPDAATVAATWDQVRDQLAARFPKIGPLMDAAKAEVLAFTATSSTSTS